MIRAVIFDVSGVLTTGGFPNGPLLTYISDQLKPHFKIGIISNAGPGSVERRIPAEYHALFDSQTLSGVVGFSKPEREIYQIALDSLDVQPDEAIYVDDIPHYANAAEALGLHGIAYTSLQALRERLAELLHK